jgi:hypothetical protein
MVDPTSDLEEDVSEEEAPSCAVCGEAIVQEVTHRVRTWVSEGAVETVHFCSEDCQADWDEAR